MNILITNDDGYQSKGIRTLSEIMKKYGNVAVVAPKGPQSGMSMAVSLGASHIAFKELRSSTFTGADGHQYTERWAYLDATPASCVKFALSTPWLGWVPDVIMSGINHGANTSVASCYSGTLGAAAEAAMNHILGIGVSLCSHEADADLGAIEALLPGIFEKLVALPRKGFMTYYNINFPKIPLSQIKGVRPGYMGRGRWVKEFKDLNDMTELKALLDGAPTGDPSEKLYKLVGDFVSDEDNTFEADHLLTETGYVSVVPHTIDSTDYGQLSALKESFGK